MLVPLDQSEPWSARGRTSQGQEPETDLGDTPAPKIIEPHGVQLVELCTRPRATIADPRLGIGVSTVSLAFNNPPVEPSGTRGVITNGGLETIGSQRKPLTGSNRFPSRNSMPVTPFKA